MRYTARFFGPAVLQRGQEQALSCPVYRSGALVAPSGGTVTIYDGSGAVVATASVTVSASIATYTLPAGTTSALLPEEGWRIEWALTISGTVHTFRTDAVLVHRRLYPVITDLDLTGLHPDLSSRLPTGSSSWQGAIDAAWGEIEGRLLEGGVRPWLILSPSALRRSHLALTLSRIFTGLTQGAPETAEARLAEQYRQEYSAAWTALTFPQADPTTGADGQPGRRRSGRPVTWLGGRG